jgi:hypothetical protein
MKITVFITFLFLQSLLAIAQPESVRGKHYNLKKGIALEGYDPVSYFNGAPQEGSNKKQLMHKSVIYFFTSDANLRLFKASPEKYEPAYGGWCAYAMGETGEKVKVDPESYKIIDGKLYLFYNFWGNNTLFDWNKNESKLKVSGDRNWQKTIQ